MFLNGGLEVERHVWSACRRGSFFSGRILKAGADIGSELAVASYEDPDLTLDATILVQLPVRILEVFISLAKLCENPSCEIITMKLGDLLLRAKSGR